MKLFPALAALLLLTTAAQAQTSALGAAQIAMQAVVSADCAVAVRADNPQNKATYDPVFGPGCSDQDKETATLAMQEADITHLPAPEPATRIFPGVPGLVPPVPYSTEITVSPPIINTPIIEPAPAPSSSRPAVVVTSTLYPDINGTYPVDAEAQRQINAAVTYLSLNGRFPGGGQSFKWADTAGALHTFATTGAFLAFATAVADYVYLASTGEAPPNTINLP